MINIQTLSSDDKAVRTQITLTEKIKGLIEDVATARGESLSEYLRKAALIRLLLEDKEKGDLEKLAERVVGSVNLNSHPEWKTRSKVQKWVRNIRSEW